MGDVLRIGIIGAARVAVYAMIAPAKENARVALAGVAARDAGRARAFAAQHGVAQAYASYDALIGDPAVDLVYVATPPALHAAIAVKADRGGRVCRVDPADPPDRARDPDGAPVPLLLDPGAAGR